MGLRTDFIEEIKQFNGRKVNLVIYQITADNHPMGEFGMMMMGSPQLQRIEEADYEYGGENGIAQLEAYMEIVETREGPELMFIANDFDCNFIIISRTSPPMFIGDIDMSLWWTFHPLQKEEVNKFKILDVAGSVSDIGIEGNSHPIREITVNGIRHCK